MTPTASPSPNRETPPTGQPPRTVAAWLFFSVNLALYFCAAVWLASLLHLSLPIPTLWARTLFPVLALATTLLALARTLPLQNVLTVAFIVIFCSTVAEIFNATFHLPFGARTFTNELGPKLFGLVPWPLPLIWVMAILNSRGVARLMLRPWRKTTKYGLWMIGLTCLLTVVFDFNLEPFASVANGWWLWRMPRSVPAWQTAPWVNFAAWGIVALLILVFVTPWLINKQRPRSSPPDYHPLGLWLLLNLLPAVGDATHQLWLPAAVAVVLATIAAVFAVHGARW